MCEIQTDTSGSVVSLVPILPLDIVGTSNGTFLKSFCIFSVGAHKLSTVNKETGTDPDRYTSDCDTNFPQSGSSCVGLNKEYNTLA